MLLATQVSYIDCIVEFHGLWRCFQAQHLEQFAISYFSQIRLWSVYMHGPQHFATEVSAFENNNGKDFVISINVEHDIGRYQPLTI